MVSEKHGMELNVGRAHFGYEVKRRSPWILLSVVAGIMMIWIGHAYEAEMARRIELVFFVPMIVYMSDIIGTETMALVVRGLATDRKHMKHIFSKEMAVGLCLGLASGVPMGLFSLYWFEELDLAITVALAMTANGVVAVLVGMLVPVAFAKLGRDPAIGTDEIATAISDNLSMLIYLAVATLILFGH